MGGLELAGRVAPTNNTPLAENAEPHAVASPNGALAQIVSSTAGQLASADDALAFEERFARLMERRTAIYTMGESTSVPKHVAVELLRSICFVLGIDPERPEIPERLLRVDLEDEFRRRLADIEAAVKLAGDLWRQAVATLPAIPNTALHDTLEEIGNFPRAYDFRSMAHEVPVMMDYPLCHPVDESTQGVAYINEWLRRLLIENDFLARFTAEDCTRVLRAASPDFVDLLVNLYEPVATNAIGLALIDRDPRRLRIGDTEREAIAEKLRATSPGARAKTLRAAAAAVCEELGIDDAEAREYLRDLVGELMPRVELGLERGELGGVFVG